MYGWYKNIKNVVEKPWELSKKNLGWELGTKNPGDKKKKKTQRVLRRIFFFVHSRA